MAKSLADMTAEERAECVGMWCDLETNKGIQQVVLYKMVEARDIGPIAYRLSFTSRHEILGFGPEDLTPRFDLPRAWTPDGEPVDGSWEKSTAELPTKDYKETFTQHYRRWVGEWEQDND